MIYNKIPKTPEELADKLISINLKAITKEQLSNILTNISYYRLKGYIYPYINNILWDFLIAGRTNQY